MAKKSKDEIIEGALAGGLIGAALGALVSKRSVNSILTALIGAAIGASAKASQSAKENNLSYLIEENGIIYEQFPDGSRKKVKKIRKSNHKIPPTFSLE